MNPTTPPQPASLPDDKNTEHELKTWPEYFEAILSGKKQFEVRGNNDRSFITGDTLLLREYDPAKGYSGRSVKVGVNYVLHGGNFGVQPGYCVLSISSPAPSKPAVVAAETKAGQLAEAIGDAFEKHLADAKMSFTPGEEDVIYSALGNALAETVQSKPAVAEETIAKETTEELLGLLQYKHAVTFSNFYPIILRAIQTPKYKA